VTATPADALVTVAAIALPFVSLAWAVRSWVYGGSKVRVEFHLGKQDELSTLAQGPVDMWRAGLPAWALHARTIWECHVNVGVVTVRNLGRTAVTVTNPGLYFGRVDRSKLFVGGTLISGGEVEGRQRIEAHDSRTYVFYLWPLVKHARRSAGKTKLRVRAQVTTGTGRNRRSSRLIWRRSWVRGNIWIAGKDDWLGDSPPSATTRVYRDALLTAPPGAEKWAVAQTVRMAWIGSQRPGATLETVTEQTREMSVVTAGGDKSTEHRTEFWIETIVKSLLELEHAPAIT